jgi:3-deoxy-D-manno-octulosonate 8-phosphate phosphatase (KDO 8-P phosphatase)
VLLSTANADGIPVHLAEPIRLVALDVDGVLSDGGIYVGQTRGGEPVEMKRFHIMDGLGMQFLMQAGIHVALVSGRVSAATTLRAAELGVECYQDAGARKVPLLEKFMTRHSADWGAVAFVSDDLPDLPVLHRVGLAVAVQNAAPEVKALASWITARDGGSGAVREFAEALLSARGQWADLVTEYCRIRGGDSAY